MVCKAPLQSEQKMSSAAYVDRARGMARFLEDHEASQVGDREIARVRLQARYGIAGSIFHSLRYRPPKQIAAEVFNALCDAVEDVATRQIRAFEHEIAEARSSRLSHREDAARKVEAVLGQVHSIFEEAMK
jgi:hypothetical protein